jgi:hypothetical protein
MEDYYHGANVDDLQQLKQELAELLEEDAKYHKLRSLPLYSAGLLAADLYVQGVMIRPTTTR